MLILELSIFSIKVNVLDIIIFFLGNKELNNQVNKCSTECHMIDSGLSPLHVPGRVIVY